MRVKATLQDEQAIGRILMRIAHEIIEHNHGVEDVVLVDILRRGMPMAERLAADIARVEGKQVPVCSLQISFYRDDLSHDNPAPTLAMDQPRLDVTDKHVILVDDVLYTGRTTLTALEAVMAMGQPKSVQLVALVDRGHREVPLRADYVGKNIPTSYTEAVRVCCTEYDGENSVKLLDHESGIFTC